MTRSKFEFYQESMMSQRLADKYPEFMDYAGADTETSVMLANFRVMHKFKMIDLESQGWNFIYALLNEQRKAKFATSEKVNEISKMGFMLPKGSKEVDFNDDTG